MLFYLINLAYFLMTCAFMARDPLRLRSLGLVGQAMIAFYAWRSGVPVISFWNVLLATINTFMAVQILRERRAVRLDPPLRALYERHFAALTPPEFLRWWRQGELRTLADEPLARNGEHPDWLYFLLRGTVRVSRNQRTVLELPAGYFVAEMSLLTNAPANADVDAIGSIDVMRWPTAGLKDLRERNPTLWTKIQSVIGHDLVEKIRRGEKSG